MVANNKAPRINQTEEGATYDPALFKPETHLVRPTHEICCYYPALSKLAYL